MKARIDLDGCLLLERAGEERKMFCFQTDNTRCGDWCPMFREPKTQYQNDLIHLELCQHTWILNELIDERKGAK